MRVWFSCRFIDKNFPHDRTSPWQVTIISQHVRIDPQLPHNDGHPSEVIASVRQLQVLDRSLCSLQPFLWLFIRRLLVNLNYTPGMKMLTLKGQTEKQTHGTQFIPQRTVCLEEPSCGETENPSWGYDSAESSVSTCHVSSCRFKDLILIRNASKGPPSWWCLCASAASHLKWQIFIWFFGSW